jgi:ribose 1,5-bisphosphokinase PhnN
MEEAINQKKLLICNVSRSSIQDAQNKYNNEKCEVVVVEITAAPELIKKRLMNRNRETEEEIDERIKRNIESSKKVEEKSNRLVRIVSNGTIQEGIDSTVEIFLMLLNENKSSL